MGTKNEKKADWETTARGVGQLGAVNVYSYDERIVIKPGIHYQEFAFLGNVPRGS